MRLLGLPLIAILLCPVFSSEVHQNIQSGSSSEHKIPPIPFNLINYFLANTGLLTVGQPETTNRVDFNLYFSDSFIVDKVADENSAYNSSESYTFRKTSRPFQLEDAARGYWATDYIGIPLTEFGSPNQPFGWINWVKGGFVSFLISTLGLGPPKDSNSFLHCVQGKLQRPIFSMHFDRFDLLPSFQFASLSFGGIDNHCRRDPVFFTDYFNVTVLQDYHPWAFRLKGLDVRSMSHGEDDLDLRVNADAAIFMFPLVIGPKKHVKRIAHRLGAKRIEAHEEFFEYSIDCAKRHSNPTVYFRIGIKKLALHPKDYILRGKDEPKNGTASGIKCYLAFQSSILDVKFGDTWLVGAPLLQSKCLIFDFGRKKIGFAAKKRMSRDA